MKTFIYFCFIVGGIGAHLYSNNKNIFRRQLSFPESTTESSTKIPPANPEVTTVYKVTCPCPFTPQYAPVCGSDGQSYANIQIFNCARFCGSNVTLVYSHACGSNRG